MSSSALSGASFMEGANDDDDMRSKSYIDKSISPKMSGDCWWFVDSSDGVRADNDMPDDESDDANDVNAVDDGDNDAEVDDNIDDVAEVAAEVDDVELEVELEMSSVYDGVDWLGLALSNKEAKLDMVSLSLFSNKSGNLLL